ncbi:hypothetical protein Trydic_g3444 [Trypoxylus dichotomus]
MERSNEEKGLTTKEALTKLCDDIGHVLRQFYTSQRNRKSRSWIKEALHHTSGRTTITWISSVFTLTCAILLIVIYMVTGDSAFYLVESLLIIVLLTLNVGFQLYDKKMRHNEIPDRVKRLIGTIERQVKNLKWNFENYPHLYSPISPCITLQWTFRDNTVVNLPWALLVKGDIILVRPGQLSPGYCESLDKSSEYPLLHARDVYGPTLHTADEIFSIPKSRKPIEYKKYRLLETPYLNNLRIALEQALDRPISQLNQQKHFLAIKLFERIILPVTLATVLVVNLIRLIYLESYIGKASPVDLFLLVPISAMLPLLPLTFPLVCTLSDYYGLARFKTLFDECRNKGKVKENILEEQENEQITHLDFVLFWRVIWKNFLTILQGKNNIIARSTNIVHVLGSLTALCCIDKKGVLSWPNPTAEKVFFLHNTDNLSNNSRNIKSLHSSLANLTDLHNDGDSLKTGNMEEGISTTIGEVLDLTHNQSDPFKLHFDDRKWQKYLPSLKPLGLSILLNTCNLDTLENYNQFCSHITCEAIYNENLVPVTNRRCLCQLAKEIGFVEQAQKIFSLEQQLSTFRHLQPEMVRRDNKYARSLSMSTKLKFPFPHMFAVVVKELSSGSMQLLSQGTADIILDSCVDYWDGHDLCSLTSSDRKKIQDFYQRSSLTAYCTAFAYRPLSKGINNKLSQVYLELPSDSRHLYHSHRSPTPVHWDCSRNVLEPKIKSSLGQFFSTDSLLYNDTPCVDVCDAETCFNMQCNQVFIGMVTMQYQAQSDMVHLIEQLERACIRFVHFSKENELRSRVFSEKMGLESGWNCHISLLSDRNRTEALHVGEDRLGGLSTRRSVSESVRKLNSDGSPPYSNRTSNLETSRTMSFSAPCAINTDHTTVKFDTENVPLMKRESNTGHMEIHKSQDSVQETYTTQHEWQSLSCLTDSTEHSAPINFDMSNRAKLPRGIDKIRPHIEQIDNVPLLVSLFTDCTATVTREMLHIMQDYGEVVSVMGSSANNENMGNFMQADASIAIEPLYPQVCQLIPPYKPVEANDVLSPIELARRLSSIACSLSVKKEEPTPIYHLIRESRHYVCCFRNSVQFWLCCCMSISLMQIIAAIFMLPALLTPGQVLWLVCFIVPLLSVSLMGTPVESDIMKRPQARLQVMFNKEISTYVLWCYGCKFLVLIIVIILTFAGTLSGYCTDFCAMKNCSCILFYLPNFENTTNINNEWTDLEHSYTLLSSQNFTVVITVLHFLCISASFVHRHNLFLNRSPHHNLMWIIMVIIVSTMQIIHTTLSLTISNKETDEDAALTTIHAFRIFACFSPLITIIVNELAKREEIKANLRYQRRARLDFGTKLGMNSPF